MRRLREEYGVFFIDDEFDAFLTNMAREKTWGNELTIRAAADAFGCTVHVLTPRTRRRRRYWRSWKTTSCSAGRATRRATASGN